MTTRMTSGSRFVSRGGDKLDAALTALGIGVQGQTCADLGSHVGGFVDCLLAHGAAKVYSIDTSYGTLAWKLRKDSRVAVLERTNAMHVALPEQVDLVTIDVAWTPQTKILPNAVRLLKPGAAILTLVKPHYEAGPDNLVDGQLPDEQGERLLSTIVDQMPAFGVHVVDRFSSPIRGHGGNREFFVLLRRDLERGQVHP